VPAGVRWAAARVALLTYVASKDGVEIFHKDWGTGEATLFHHGRPLPADDWDAQMMFFLSKGYGVIAHDRRGHSPSTQTPASALWVPGVGRTRQKNSAGWRRKNRNR
jgi:pimeloyl-ACP methyl ester carboxylesterase